jgi:enoyl-[acyl-carrier protein] reductase I
MGFMTGKRALIVGVATDRSIAWGIAKAMHREGAKLAISYANDKLKERVLPLAAEVGALTLPLDVTVDREIEGAFELLKREWGGLDVLVHAVAYAPREALTGYNVMGLAKASLEANVRFLAADMGPAGIRVNGISAGPIKTLAAAGIPGFRKMLGRVADMTPLRRNVTLEDVGNAAAFLCSDLSAGITGEILYVDCGYNTVGMSFPLEAEG